MRILVTGSNGLLGQKIVGQLVHSDIEFLATSTGENRNTNCPDSSYRSMDISNDSQVKSAFQFFSPDYVIHTAAITNVDYF
jgi:dTDP-4-dehydrorhamnose reductase